MNRSWALAILLPSIMVELDVGGAEQAWSNLTFWGRGGHTYQCRGIGKPGHLLLPEARCSRTPSSSSRAHPLHSHLPDSAPLTLASASLPPRPAPPCHRHLCFPPTVSLPPLPGPDSSPPSQPQEKADPRLWGRTHPALTPNRDRGQITSLLLNLNFPRRQNKVFVGIKSDLVCDDDANNSYYLSRTLPGVRHCARCFEHFFFH